ncbi:histone-lysine N-methyltransferase KMT5B-like [Acyrthosiphon pisum]|uniref:SET domain-containing protein n=1 Tax=Acyrthosiphon pisum TaxID=7029 RepID=A0A8R2B3T6_ACYPI|nr:histone-lysine N-methyltransferase KMT5B-like [Acyrthosiphon pisum]|eukprot:XP_008178346.1 PREDICTED: histone-lysine N-methyltransferase KMT5B-like [Acyrthosiphon pisum]
MTTSGQPRYMDDEEWPLKCDRRAAVLCVADDACLNTILDKILGIQTHRNNTPQFHFKDSEIRHIVFKQQLIYKDFCNNPVPYTIQKHNRFDELNGAKVVATKHIKKNIVLFELCGQLYPFSDKFLIPGVNDFSTVTSSVNDKDYMFLGPVSFINHDCHPNTQWHSRTKTLSCVKTLRDIFTNEEITLF